MIDLRVLRDRWTEAGARQVFAQLVTHCVRAELPAAQAVRPDPGDYGIDTFAGEFDGRLHIFQAKYFCDGLGESQKKQVRDSFTRCISSGRFPKLAAWTLCLPIDLSVEEHGWWQRWSEKVGRRARIRMNLWTASTFERFSAEPRLAPVFAVALDRRSHTGTPPLNADMAVDTMRRLSIGVIDRLAFDSSAHASPAIKRMLDDYDGLFGGRDEALRDLDAFAAHPDWRNALLVAGTGAGKTALLIQWAKRLGARGEWHVVFHPVSRRYGTATADSLLWTVANGLARAHGEAVMEPRGDLEGLRARVYDLLSKSPPQGVRCMVILDGLDEMIGADFDRTFLPRTLPAGLKLVASAREMALRPPDFWLAQLGWQSQATKRLSLGGLPRSAVEELLAQAGRPAAALLDDASVIDQLFRISRGDPLTLRFLIDDIATGAMSPDGLRSMPTGLEALIEHWLRELDAVSGADERVSLLLGLLTTAYAPLTGDDIQRLAPDLFERRATLRQAIRAINRFVIGDDNSPPGLSLSHPRLIEVLSSRASHTERLAWRTRFLDYGAAAWPDTARPLSDYLRHFYVRHLADAERWEDLKRLVTGGWRRGDSRTWAMERQAAEGSYAAYLTDLAVFREHAGRTRDIGASTRCALITASIRSVSATLLPDLIVDLVTVGTSEGRWSPTAALQYIEQMPELVQFVPVTSRKTRALLRLCATCVALSPDLLVEVASNLASEEDRSAAFGTVAGRIPDDRRQQLVAAALGFVSPRWRVQALVALAPHLSEAQRAEIIPLARIIAQGIRDPDDRASALISVAPLVGARSRKILLDDAFRAAIVGRGAFVDFAALKQLSRMVERPMALQMYDVARRFPIGVTLLPGIARWLPRELIDLAWLGMMRVAGARAVLVYDSLIDFTLNGPFPSQKTLALLIDEARALASHDGRARVLASLAVLARGEQADALWADTLAALRAPERVAEVQHTRGHDAAAWVELLSLMPSGVRDGHWMDMIDAAAPIPAAETTDDDRDPLCDIIDVCPPELLAHIRARIAREDPEAVPGRLVHLGRRVGGVEQTKLIAEALTGSRRINDENAAGDVLGALGPVVSASRVLDAHAAIRALPSPEPRSEALAALTSGADGPARALLWEEALDAAAAIRNDTRRAHFLKQAAPLVPDELVPRIRDLALAMPAENRTRVLEAIVERLPGTLASDTWETILAIPDRTMAYFTSALNRAPLSKKRRDERWAAIVELAIDDTREDHGLVLLEYLAKNLPKRFASRVFATVRKTPDDLLNTHTRWRLIRTAASLLAPDRIPGLLRFVRRPPVPYNAAPVLCAIASRPDCSASTALFEEAVRLLESTALGMRPPAIIETLPLLPEELWSRLLRVARADGDERASEALVAFGTHLNGDDLVRALRMSLPEWNENAMDEWTRTLGSLFAAEARRSPEFADDSFGIWHELLGAASRDGRPGALRFLACFAPWLAVIAPPNVIDDIFDAAIAVRVEWP